MYPRVFFPPRFFPPRYYGEFGDDPIVVSTAQQSRSGIERSGATRTGFYIPNMVCTINGSNVSRFVRFESLRVSLRLNDQPDEAHFTLIPSVGIVPLVNQEIAIGLGTAAHRIFAGQIIRCRHRRLQADKNPWYDVECVDYNRLLDRRLITTEYTSESATAITKDIIANWTAGFTVVNVQSALPDIEYFPLTNETPSNALRRLVALMGGGGFYIDTHRDLHLFDTNGELTTRAPTRPVTLTNALDTLKSFAHEYDASQQRTRVIAEGAATTALVDVEAPALVADGGYGFPIKETHMFAPVGQPEAPWGRIGTQVFNYSHYLPDGITQAELTAGTSDPGLPPAIPGVVAGYVPSAVTAADANPGDTSITTVAGSPMVSGSYHFIRDDAGNVFLSEGVAQGIINNIPASGFGSIRAPIPAGTTLVFVPGIFGIQNEEGGPAGSAGLVRAMAKGDPVVSRVRVSDATAQSTLAALEGGDGIREHIIMDGRLGFDGAMTRAEADLDTFKDPLLSAQWDTLDLNAQPGTLQVINMSGADALSATLMITHVELEFIKDNFTPLRHCEASTVRLALPIEMAAMESV